MILFRALRCSFSWSARYLCVKVTVLKKLWLLVVFPLSTRMFSLILNIFPVFFCIPVGLLSMQWIIVCDYLMTSLYVRGLRKLACHGDWVTIWPIRFWPAAPCCLAIWAKSWGMRWKSFVRISGLATDILIRELANMSESQPLEGGRNCVIISFVIRAVHEMFSGRPNERRRGWDTCSGYFVCWISQTGIPDILLWMYHCICNHTKLHHLPAVFNRVDLVLP
jgi:hypothetical protein